jgi:hypothetical protein
MDTGKGGFTELGTFYEDEMNQGEALKAIEEAQRKYPNHGGTFFIGQNIELDGSKFRVLAITKHTMTLRLLPK